MLKKYILEKLLLKKRIQKINEKKKLYSRLTSDKEIYEYQLEKFNYIWKYAYSNIPFYIQWKKIHNLPDKLQSITELKSFPILTKKDIIENKQLIFDSLANYQVVLTGGTSGITTEFPVDERDSIEAYSNAYLGRSWWGIKPFDKILMFWGHVHIFGHGFSAKIMHYKKKLSDNLINTTKISSYGLDHKNVKNFYNAICENAPECIISYASNIYKICKYMEDKHIYYSKNNLKGIILTAESVTESEIELIHKHFSTNIINEYGMVETGPIGCSYQTTKNIKIFWGSFIITTNESEELLLTTLGSKLFPLINYSSEDVIKVNTMYNDSIFTISEIKGKIRNVLNAKTQQGTFQKISTILFDHILKFYPSIYSIQYKQNNEYIEIYLTSNIQLNLTILHNYMENKMKIEFNDIDSNYIRLIQIDKLEKTIAGKNKTLL